ncbi:MAG TPA: glycosyltransferase [Thermoanaerobaculia bacterium]|nr:glycosyltransferase [Thermoanaerobaculia bacterium]
MSPRAPVAVFTYDRPRHLRRTLEALARCPGFATGRLHLYCDAPARAADGPSCDAARRVARDWVRRRGGRLIERDGNRGFRNITDAISELCAGFGRVVVIEDDVVVSPDFLGYVERGLDRYANDPRVFLIGGYMFAADHPPEPPLFFLPVALAWGWATWERAWKQYEYLPRDWQGVLSDAQSRRRFDVGGSFPYARTLRRTMEGKFDSWDTQWYFTLFRAGGLGLYPARSLVWNSGIDGGVHGRLGRKALDRTHPVFHGELARDDFAAPRLPPGWPFPGEVGVDAPALARLGRALARIHAMGSPGKRIRPLPEIRDRRETGGRAG